MVMSDEALPPRPSLTVLLVDAFAARLAVLKVLVESQTVGATVVGTACDGATAVEAVHSLSPNIVLVEIQLPVSTGMDTLAQLRTTFPSLPLVVCSFRRDRETKAQATTAGANVYLDKPVTAQQIAAAFLQVAPLPSYEPEMS